MMSTKWTTSTYRYILPPTYWYRWKSTNTKKKKQWFHNIYIKCWLDFLTNKYFKFSFSKTTVIIFNYSVYSYKFRSLIPFFLQQSGRKYLVEVQFRMIRFANAIYIMVILFSWIRYTYIRLYELYAFNFTEK